MRVLCAEKIVPNRRRECQEIKLVRRGIAPTIERGFQAGEEGGYAALRLRRLCPTTNPIPPSNDQIARVEGSGTGSGGGGGI